MFRVIASMSVLLFAIGRLAAQEPATVTAGRQFLITCHKPSQVMIVDEQGAIRWSCDVTHPQDAAVLPDGRVLTSETGGARIIDAAKQVVWQYRVPTGCQNPVAQPLPDGGVLVGNEGPCRLLEVDAASRVRREIPLTTAFKGNHGQFRFCRKTPEGTYLVPFTHDGVVKEVDQDGKEVRVFPPLAKPVSAIRLPDRHTLIGAQGVVKEYGADGTLAWEVTNADIHGPERIDIITSVARLRNGNTLAGNYTGDDSHADVLEINAAKQVVWSLRLIGITHVAMVQMLGADGRPSDEVLAR